MSESAVELTKEDIALETAKRYLADKAYISVLGKSQASKLRQVLKNVDVEGVSMRLLRDVMAESSKFEIVDRRWAASVRFGDNRKPFESMLIDILRSAGVPLSLETLAGEMAQVYGRPAEYYERMLPRLLADKETFFAAEGLYGLASWLLVTSSDDEADVIFDSFMSEDVVEKFTSLCPTSNWDVDNLADGAEAVLKACKGPVPLKVLALFAWRDLEVDFDAIDFASAIFSDDQILVLSDQKVYPAAEVKNFTATLTKLSEELAKLPMEVEEEEAEGPVAITDTDKEEIISMIIERGSASAAELLDAVLEIGSDEASFAGTFENLKEALAGDERIMWIGGSRWSKVETFPDEVQCVSALLVVPPSVPFETAEGDVYDQMLEEDGFEGNLKSAMYDPLAEDVSDEDPARTIYQPNGDRQRCVLKYHHKIEGTLPLCQINPDFFGTEPEIIPIVLIDEGKRKSGYVNNSTRLVYGLKDFYKDITEISGSVFYIEKTTKPGEYRIVFDGAIDDQLGIDTNRSLELLDLKARSESSEMPMYDVIKEVLSKQGMPFAQIVNEVSIVKRCSRLLIASILSSYHAFHTRGKSDEWLFDTKKESQGFNKTKKKYIKKD